MTAMESVNSPRFGRITLPSDYIQSCSTFMLCCNGAFFVGHNLDDYSEVPGLVVVNKRGLEKGVLVGKIFTPLNVGRRPEYSGSRNMAQSPTTLLGKNL